MKLLFTNKPFLFVFYVSPRIYNKIVNHFKIQEYDSWLHKMEEFNCSLCCDKTFSSKQSLIEHLLNVLYNLSCPICNCKLSSLSTLVEHLTLNNCEAQNIDQAVVYLRNNSLPENDVTENSNSEQFSLIDAENHNDVTPDPFSSEHSPDHNADVGEIYVELLSKQMSKPCLQTQGVKLIMEEGENHYTLITNDDPSYSSQTVVTKQNSDGTISLIDEKDIKSESLPINSMRNVKQHKEATSYSCNTCGVTFTSVLDHIQNYHNDQDVVVEEPADDNSSVIPIEYDSLVLYNNMSDKRMAQRVITESGNIVEALLDSKDDAGTHQEPTVEQTTSDEIEEISTESSIKKEEAEIYEKNEKETTKQYIKVDELGYSFVKDVKNGKKEPYHKVLVKEMQMVDGDNKTKVKVYNCVTCHIYVTNVEEFKQHPCKLNYPCPQCPAAYDNSKALCAHMKAHKNVVAATDVDSEDNGIYKCGICSTVFPTNKSLKLHKRMHDPIKSRPIEPPLTLASGEAVSADKYLCAVCDKLIPKDYKAIHQSFHRNDNALNCDICNRKFQSAEYLQMHMKVHNLDKVPVNNQDKSLPYNCLYCNRQFARPHEKVKHERIHTGEKPHSCEICGKSFRVSYCLTLHMRTHTGARPYACPHCGKRFKAHSVYNHHLQTHSEVRAYKCPYCPKAFKTSVQLAGHKNSHTKPFSCQHCNRPFASLYAVRVHTETHLRQNNLKFSCALCGASYARTFALRDHMKQAHDKEMDAADPIPNNKDNDWAMAEIIKKDSNDTQSQKNVDHV